MRQLFAVAENYPQLKADQHFLMLQSQLGETEDRIAAGRRFYEQGSPAHAAAMAALEGPQATAMMDSVERHLQTLADADGQVRIDAEYLLITAVAARPEGSGDEG
jgi:hypothetical protein